jgi:hypothetical protein
MILSEREQITFDEAIDTIKKISAYTHKTDKSTRISIAIKKLSTILENLPKKVKKVGGTKRKR